MPPVTAREPGAGSSTISYTIPGDGLDVETVRVAVDATAAAGAVTATVTITDQSGVVIATKPQNATIPAGAVGSATWALRLDDETSGGGGTDPLAVHFNTIPQSDSFLEVETTGVGGITLISRNGTAFNITAHGAGTETLNLTTDLGQIFLGSFYILNKLRAGGRFFLDDSSSFDLIEIKEDGTQFFNLKFGKQFSVRDSSLNTILRVDEGSGGAPTYHIKTGAAWVADL